MGLPAVPTSALEAAGAVVTDTSLTISGEIPWDLYEQLGAFLGTLGRAYRWWVGDFLCYGEQVFAEDQFSQIEQQLEGALHQQTLTNYASIARHVPRSRRRPQLSMSTHAEVAYLEPKVRDQWLDVAVERGWKREHMREALALTDKDVTRLGSVEGQMRLAGREANASTLQPGPVHRCPNCGHEFEEAA